MSTSDINLNKTKATYKQDAFYRFTVDRAVKLQTYIWYYDKNSPKLLKSDKQELQQLLSILGAYDYSLDYKADSFRLIIDMAWQALNNRSIIYDYELEAWQYDYNADA